MTKQDINKQILEVATSLIQTKGYNAFSYRDIVEVVGVKTSSIHYHFPAKEDLGKAVVKQHVNTLEGELERIMSNVKQANKKKLEQFFDSVFEITYFADRKMCLGGMLASDVLTLPEGIQSEIKRFFTRIEEWLVQLLDQGVESQEFSPIKDRKKEAALILSILEGSLLLARLYHDEKRLAQAKESVVSRLIGA